MEQPGIKEWNTCMTRPNGERQGLEKAGQRMYAPNKMMYLNGIPVLRAGLGLKLSKSQAKPGS